MLEDFFLLAFIALKELNKNVICVHSIRFHSLVQHASNLALRSINKCAENQRQRRNLRLRSQRQSDSCVLSSDDEDETRDNDVYVTDKVSRELGPLEDETASSKPSGTVSCPICMDGYSEIVQSGRLIVSTKCGHVFCSQCLRDSLRNANSCPTCRKKLTHRQYHPIYI
ncbi:E3 ubiquitin-protein ligase RNF4-like isoform X11 [Accipiter gentilis]|uniref:E3 ubiquitin-protein ligase RNF4-like isoform X11 n=1 Tax=Astur gentilis TaxID=8957 RepID=UPI00210FB56F|nr:E3 ubiquitin-protein ligase RNF4-like isoform X11 [Accipiter gentilis]